MPAFEVTVTRTRTITDECAIEVTAKDEDAAEAKAAKQVESKPDNEEWSISDEDISYEYSVSEA